MIAPRELQGYDRVGSKAFGGVVKIPVTGSVMLGDPSGGGDILNTKYKVLLLETSSDKRDTFDKIHGEYFDVETVGSYSMLVHKINTGRKYDLILVDMFAASNTDPRPSQDEIAVAEKRITDRLSEFHKMKIGIRKEISGVWETQGIKNAIDLRRQFNDEEDFPAIAIFSKFGSTLTSNYDFLSLQMHSIYWAWKNKKFDAKISEEDKEVERQSILQIIAANHLRHLKHKKVVHLGQDMLNKAKERYIRTTNDINRNNLITMLLFGASMFFFGATFQRDILPWIISHGSSATDFYSIVLNLISSAIAFAGASLLRTITGKKQKATNEEVADLYEEYSLMSSTTFCDD